MIEYEVDMRVFKFYFLIELIWPQMLIFSLLLLARYIIFFYVNMAKLLVSSLSNLIALSFTQML